MPLTTAEVIDNYGWWPMDVLPVKRERRLLLETGYIRAAEVQPGAVIVHTEDGSWIRYASAEAVADAGWVPD